MKIITLPCFNIIVRLGIDEGDSPEAQQARENGVDADIHAEWPEAKVKEGDVCWQDAYRNALSGFEDLILHHARHDVQIKSDGYIEGLKDAVKQLQELYQLGSECYGGDEAELPEEGYVFCEDYVTATNVAHSLLLKDQTFLYEHRNGQYVFFIHPQAKESGNGSSRSGEDSDRRSTAAQEESPGA